jgi:tetratricopeptide (TPR) repeat protein
MVGEGAYRPYFYVAQANLEPLSPPPSNPDSTLPSYFVNHRNIARFFNGYDLERQRYRVSHKLKYCFPFDYHLFPTDYPNTSILSAYLQREQQQLQQQASTAAAVATAEASPSLPDHTFAKDRSELERLRKQVIKEEIIIFEKVDKCLLTLHDYLSRWLDGLRVNYALDLIDANRAPEQSLADDVPKSSKAEGDVKLDDFFYLLKHSFTKELSQGVENVIWFSWIAHSSPEVNVCMRLALSYMKRNNLVRAGEIFHHIVKDLDPEYAEGYNKLAAVYYTLGNYQESIKYANMALIYFPYHYGAFVGLALSYEQLGKSSPLHPYLIFTPLSHI